MPPQSLAKKFLLAAFVFQYPLAVIVVTGQVLLLQHFRGQPPGLLLIIEIFRVLLHPGLKLSAMAFRHSISSD